VTASLGQALGPLLAGVLELVLVALLVRPERALVALARRPLLVVQPVLLLVEVSQASVQVGLPEQ
jgi:hypothetical protein